MTWYNPLTWFGEAGNAAETVSHLHTAASTAMHVVGMFTTGKASEKAPDWVRGMADPELDFGGPTSAKDEAVYLRIKAKVGTHPDPAKESKNKKALREYIDRGVDRAFYLNHDEHWLSDPGHKAFEMWRTVITVMADENEQLAVDYLTAFATQIAFAHVSTLRAKRDEKALAKFGKKYNRLGERQKKSKDLVLTPEDKQESWNDTIPLIRSQLLSDGIVLPSTKKPTRIVARDTLISIRPKAEAGWEYMLENYEGWLEEIDNFYTDTVKPAAAKAAETTVDATVRVASEMDGYADHLENTRTQGRASSAARRAALWGFLKQGANTATAKAASAATAVRNRNNKP